MNIADMGYEVILADTEESRNIHYNLRYQVYCLDKGYEEASEFPDELETDEYDERAVHFLIRRRGDHRWAATFRLIIDKLENLPIHHHAALTSPESPAPETMVTEFSRLAIMRAFQKVPGEAPKPSNDPDLCIFFRAICAGVEYSRNVGANRIVFLCRRSLVRIVNAMGIRTPQIGEKTVFRGIRYPYNLDLSDFPLRLFETPKSLQAFHRGNSFIAYSKLTAFEKAAAA